MLLYRLILSLLTPLLAWPLLRCSKADRAQRLGHGAPACDIWLHGASNGELTAAKPLVEALLQTQPGLRLLITCNSLTGRALAESWNLPQVSARLAPLDLRWVLKRFLHSAAPRLLLVIENELWPNRMQMMQARGGAVALVSARMSEKSATGWARLPGTVAQVMGLIDLLCAQDAASQARFAALGVDKAAIGPLLNLKTRTAPGGFDPQTRADFAQLLVRSHTLLAASTHEGEEEIVLEGFAKAVSYRPELRLILAPRHPKRGDAVARLIRQHGLSFSRRSAHEQPDAQVYLADTLGEMGLWYELAELCFVGGSLVPKGGHTPFEPIAHDCVLLHGLHLDNYTEPYAALVTARASLPVQNAKTLSQALLSLDPASRERLKTTASEVAQELHRPLRLGPTVVALLALANRKPAGPV